MSAPQDIIDDLRFLHPPRGIPQSLLLGLAIALALLLALRIWKRRPRPAVVAAAESAGSEFDAVEELQKLRPLALAATGREFAIASSGVLRRFFEVRFELPATRFSSEELLREIVKSPLLAPPRRESLRGFLAGCDLLKFGAGRASDGELGELLEAALKVASDDGQGKA